MHPGKIFIGKFSIFSVNKYARENEEIVNPINKYDIHIVAITIFFANI